MINTKLVLSWVLFFTTFVLSFAQAATLKTEEDLRPFVDSVMKNVGSGDLQSAFKTMQPFVVISENEFQSAALASKTQREQFGNRFGKTIGTEFIAQQKVGDSLIRIVFIEKTEKHALPWYFYFYKSQNGWVLNTFNWNDQMPALFIGK
jgi:hypothetical protein